MPLSILHLLVFVVAALLLDHLITKLMDEYF